MSAESSMDTNKAIKELVARIEKLEKTVFGNTRSPEAPDQKEFKGATGGLRLLLSKGYFNQRRNFGQIKEALSKENYHYSNQAVQTPLNNLSKASGPLVSFREGGKKVYAKRK